MEVVEEDVESDSMEGVELFFMNENYMEEAVYYWGNSSNKEIFELMLRLVNLDLRGYFRIHNIWVSGTRK